MLVHGVLESMRPHYYYLRQYLTRGLDGGDGRGGQMALGFKLGLFSQERHFLYFLRSQSAIRMSPESA